MVSLSAAGTDLAICLHCRDKPTRPWVARGLCPRCYKDLEVRMRYPVLQRPGVKPGVRDGSYRGAGGNLALEEMAKALRLRQVRQGGVPLIGPNDRPMPKEPTEAMPGTLDKVEVMAARAKLGEELFHPLDAMWG